MSKIKQIDPSIHHSLQSQVKLNRLSDIIRELTQNGVDSGANNITIKLKVNYIEKAIEIEYLDNGEGLDPDSLEFLGKRFFTSKLTLNSENEPPINKLNRLKQLGTFGFRGEAFNSLLNTCESAIVISRVKEYNSGFKACFVGDKLIGDVIKHDSIVPVGTSIRIIGLFDPMIVRKKLLFDNIEKSWIGEIFEIKKTILDCLIDKPWIKIEILKSEFKVSKWLDKVIVKNSVLINNEKVPLQLQINSFKSIFGEKICQDFEICKVQYKDFQLKAAIGLSTIQTKSYQFIYLNGRPFLNDELIRSINQLFQKNYELWGHNIKTHNNKACNKKSSNMYGRPYSTNAIFIAKFNTPFEISELIQDPSKVCYYTKNIQILESLFSKVIEVYFGIFKRRKKIEGDGKELSIDKEYKVNKKKAIRNTAILNSNVRISRFRESEINGRYTKNNEKGEFLHRICDLDKIKEGLVQSNDDKKDDDIELSCDHCYRIQSQVELKNQSEFFRKIENLELNRNDIDKFQIIGQVDKKFILVKFENKIIGLDQHAADERFNVEKMFKELIELCFTESSGKMNNLEEQIKLGFNKTEIEMIEKYNETLNFWGIKFDSKLNTITHLPKIISDKILKLDKDVLKKGISQFLYNLHEYKKVRFGNCHYGQTNNKTDQFWWVKYVSHMPDLYREAIKSRACRMSVMFGQNINQENLSKLVFQLKDCYDPFICAHGRPSLYPICGIT